VDWEFVVVVAVAIVVMIVAALVGLAVLRAPREGRSFNRGQATSIGMSLGMLFGAALGTIVWVSTGQFVFWVIFLGGGMTVGLALGNAMGARR
jgi:hypothetical protein